MKNVKSVSDNNDHCLHEASIVYKPYNKLSFFSLKSSCYSCYSKGNRAAIEGNMQTVVTKTDREIVSWRINQKMIFPRTQMNFYATHTHTHVYRATEMRSRKMFMIYFRQG